MTFPEKSRSYDDVMRDLLAADQYDIKYKDGKLFSLTYGISDEHYKLLGESYAAYIGTNGLGKGFVFQSLGGIRAAKAKRKNEETLPSNPEVVVPLSAHPAFEKACELMDLTLVRTPLRDDTRADLNAFKAAITDNTIAMAGSAPTYPYGTIDDIPEMAAIAADAGIHFHTDACVGGFALPWLKKAGHPGIPDFDFSVPGVTTISADIHKYGFAARGTSLILYRDRDISKHAIFKLGTWTGGPYLTPTLAGSRPGGALAAAWATVQRLGQEGYTKVHTELRATAEKYMTGVTDLGYRILGDPRMSLFAFCTDDPALDINTVADEMLGHGWVILRQPTTPPSLHLLLTPKHAPVLGEFIADLKAATEAARATGAVSAETSNYTK